MGLVGLGGGCVKQRKEVFHAIIGGEGGVDLHRPA
jgi:hypothetical protein